MTSLQIERDSTITLGEKEFNEGLSAYGPGVFRSDAEAFKAGMFWRAIAGNAHAKRFCRAHDMWNVQSGDYLVPNGTDAAFYRLRQEFGIFERFARKLPLRTDLVSVPRTLADATAHWVDDGGAIGSSDLSFGSAELDCKKLGALCFVSDELLWDSVSDIGSIVMSSMANAFAEAIDRAAFLGDGSSTYGHVTGLASVLDDNAIHQATSGNTTASTLDEEDWLDTCKLLTDFGQRARPRWFMNRKVYFESCRGFGDQCETINGERYFAGYPVSFASVMSDGTAADTHVAYLGDLSLASTLGYNKDMRVTRSDDRYLDSDYVAYRGVQRLAINIHERGDTAQTRPIVGLKTA